MVAQAIEYGLIDQILGSKRPDKLIKSDIKFGSFGGEEQKFGDKDWAPADDLTVDDPAAA